MDRRKRRRLPLPSEIEPAEERFVVPTLDTGIEVEGGRVLRRIALDRIRPDFSQPRRVLPPDLHESTRAGKLDAQEALTALMRRREEGDLVASLILSHIERLASSIALGEVGLRHPINVYELADPSSPTGRSYRIGEGECRWWAYNLLALQGYEEARTIPCLIEGAPAGEMGVLTRQQAENLARLRLPAVAQARALARVKDGLRNLFQGALRAPEEPEGLITEKLGEVPEEFASRLVKWGLGERIPDSNELDDIVGEWMGIVGKSITGRMVRDYLSIPNLPHEALELAEAASIPVATLIPIIGLNDPTRQLELTRKVVAEGLSARQTKRAARQLTEGTTEKPFVATFGRRLLPLARRVKDMSPPELREFAGGLVREERYRDICEAILALSDLIRATQRTGTTEDRQ